MAEERSKKVAAAAAAAVHLSPGRFRTMEEEELELVPANSLAAAAAAAASLLTDDLIVEILSRLPVRSVHRFKCVCKLWRDLIAQPAHRKKLPQTLAGFLYTDYDSCSRHDLAAVSPTVVDLVDPSLAFLRPMNYTKIRLEHTCNGLLLCTGFYNKEERLVVCNPATRRWTELPPPPKPQPNTYYHVKSLAFDPALSPSHFHVLDFEKTNDEGVCIGVSIYSSRTGAWTHRNIELLDKIYLTTLSVFAGGMLYLHGMLCEGSRSYSAPKNYVLLVVDMEWKAWKTLRVPCGQFTRALGWSQGSLHLATRSYEEEGEEVAVWCLEDYGSQKWSLKNTVRVYKLPDYNNSEYLAVGIHPDCDTVFFVAESDFDGESFSTSSVSSWDMRRLEFRIILQSEDRSAPTYLPYVPMFSESTHLEMCAN